MTTLRTRLVRLAYTNHDIRPHLLPLLKTASATFDVVLRDIVYGTPMYDAIVTGAVKELSRVHKRKPRLNTGQLVADVSTTDVGSFTPANCRSTIETGINNCIRPLGYRSYNLTHMDGWSWGASLAFPEQNASRDDSAKQVAECLPTLEKVRAEINSRHQGSLSFIYVPGETYGFWLGIETLSNLAQKIMEGR